MGLIDEMWTIIKRNFIGHTPPPRMKHVCSAALPDEIECHVAWLGADFEDSDDVNRRLNLPHMSFKHSGLRKKYVYEYKRKFGTQDYYEHNKVTDEEWLRPLENHEHEDFLRTSV